MRLNIDFKASVKEEGYRRVRGTKRGAIGARSKGTSSGSPLFDSDVNPARQRSRITTTRSESVETVLSIDRSVYNLRMLHRADRSINCTLSRYEFQALRNEELLDGGPSSINGSFEEEKKANTSTRE